MMDGINLFMWQNHDFEHTMLLHVAAKLNSFKSGFANKIAPPRSSMLLSQGTRCSVGTS